MLTEKILEIQKTHSIFCSFYCTCEETHEFSYQIIFIYLLLLKSSMLLGLQTTHCWNFLDYFPLAMPKIPVIHLNSLHLKILNLLFWFVSYLFFVYGNFFSIYRYRGLTYFMVSNLYKIFFLPISSF